MKTIKQGVFGAVALLLASAAHSLAIEGLQLSLQCTNVVLSWPGVEGDVYIVQSRPDLSLNSSWTTLTNSFPAASGTNLTVFIDYGAVSNANCGGSSGSQQDANIGGQFSFHASTGGNLSAVNASSSNASPSWPPLPPLPPGLQYAQNDSGQMTIIVAASGGSSGGFAMDESSGFGLPSPGGSPTPDDGTNSTSPVQMAFYQVVKAGVHLYGFTNGMTLSGVVALPIEFGTADTNWAAGSIFLTDNDSDDEIYASSFPSLPVGGPRITGSWDTTQVTNGIYALQVEALLDDGTVYLDHPVTVTVSNLMWFPDPWNIFGGSIYIGAQTPYTDGTGTWRVDAWDDQNNYVGYFPGIIDTNGYLSYAGNTGVGFSINNTDGNGNQLPSTYYTLVFQGDVNHPLAVTPPYTFTNVVLSDVPWDFAPTYSTVIYLDVFGDGKPEAQKEELDMMQAVAGAENSYHPLESGVGDPINVYQLGLNGNWTNVFGLGLSIASCRDFVYFGHGGPGTLGTGPNLLLTSAQAAANLTNDQAIFGNPLIGPNYHAYRYVFLDGCQTADGNWPQAFGIPKETGMVITDFTTKRSIRPRAFMGWNRKKQIGWVDQGVMNPDHATYIGNFWSTWQKSAYNAHQATLTDAIFEAGREYNTSTGTYSPNPQAGGMVLYGAQDLTILQ